MNLCVSLLLSCCALALASNTTSSERPLLNNRDSDSSIIRRLVEGRRLADPDCTASAKGNNGFGKTECGSKPKKCCHPVREKCVGPFKPKDGKVDQYVCSSNRALYGIKLVKVVFIPMFGMSFLLFCLLYMGKEFKSLENKKDPLKILCMVQVLCCSIIMCSERWKTAIYTGLLAISLFVFMKDVANKWVVGGFITLSFFNVLAIMGTEDGKNGVFIPLGLLASTGAISWEKGMMEKANDAKAATCSDAYEKYFTLESIEISHEGSDPKVSQFGFCSDTFLATVAVFLMTIGTIQFIMTVLSFGHLIPHLGDGRGAGKTAPQ